ncbi:MAG: enoyl-CoA hydratase [Chloroflexi bacterium OLB14]|nr:MAG: enoyl-CoA hydratase [Chloroflexi bacterium OLB14]
MTYTNILTETRGRVSVVQLNRPDAMNALNTALLKEVMQAFEVFDRDEAVGAIVVTGNEKAFAAGADIKEMADLSFLEIQNSELIASFERILNIKKPIIAAVSGWALGGGFEFVLACDMIIASESAKFGLPEVTIGVIPGAGGTQRLTHVLGKYLAMEVVMNNRKLSANEALQFGLVNRVVPVEGYLESAVAFAEEIASRAPVAIRMAKDSINAAFETTLAEGLKVERRNFYPLFATQDQKEGMKAFVEKRKAEWIGK